MEEYVAHVLFILVMFQVKSCDNLLLYHFQSSHIAEKYGWD